MRPEVFICPYANECFKPWDECDHRSAHTWHLSCGGKCMERQAQCLSIDRSELDKALGLVIDV